MSAEHLKQLRIKTKILMRLRKEYQSYQKETLGFENKQHKLEEELHLGANKEELELQLTKNVTLPPCSESSSLSPKWCCPTSSRNSSRPSKGSPSF